MNLIAGHDDGLGAGHEPSNQVSGAICGHPIWRDSHLTRIAASETPVAALLHAYQTWPESFLDKIGGHFSLYIMDRSRGRTLLAVDRFGIGPMFWSSGSGRKLYFGNRLQNLAAQLPHRPDLNLQSVYEYVYFHCIPSPNTIWKDIHKLAPSELIEFKDGGASQKTYWTPSFHNRDSGFSELKDQLFEALNNGVRINYDNKATGAFLSGGLDSSTICGMLREQSGPDSHAFTVSFDLDAYNELDFARIAAKHFDLKHHVIKASANETADRLFEIFSALDEPFGNSSVVPTYLCALAASDAGIDNLLAGDGGDELFAGNTRYAKQQLFEKYKLLPRRLRTAAIEPIFLKVFKNVQTTPIRKVRRYIQQAKISLPARLETYNYLEMWSGREIFCGDFMHGLDVTQPLQLLESRYHQPKHADVLDRMLYLDWKFTLADNDLRKVTSMCELAGIDVRFPFLDEDLVEMSTRVPSAMKLRGRQLRFFYKKAMKDYLPKEILTKSKHGFGLPFGEWLKTSPKLQESIYGCLSDLKKREIVSAHFLDNLILQHRDGHAAYYGEAVWIFSALEMWFKTHNDLLS